MQTTEPVAAGQEAKSTIPRGQGVITPEPLRAAVAATVQAIGERAAAVKLGVGRTTLARVLGGLSVRPGSLALIREHLAPGVASAAPGAAPGKGGGVGG